MIGRFYFLTFILIVMGVSSAFAQSGRPVPSPSATPVNDAQGVAPEDLQGVPQVAPGYQSVDRSLPELGRIGVELTAQKTLTLREAIEMALTNNRDIEVSRKTEQMAEYDFAAARGFYQTRLVGKTYYERVTVPNTSIFSTNEKTTSRNILGDATITGYYPKYGTVFQGSFSETQVSSNNPISIISPQYNTNLNFNFTQPLMRGRKIDQPRRLIEIARRNMELTDIQFRQRSIETVASVQRAYWDLTYALRNLQVQRDSLKDAKDQLEHNKRLVNEGQLAPIDVTAAETQVANFEQTVYDALNTANLSENALKNLIAPNRTDAIWSYAITPVEPVEVATPNTSLPEAMDIAVNNRPELEINQTQKDINLIDQRFYADQKKPQIDLVGSYTSTGIGGALNRQFVNPFARTACEDPTSAACLALIQAQQAFIANIGGPFSSFSDIFANKYPTVRFGITFNIPFGGDKTAAAQFGRSRVEGERLDVQREQIEQSIQVEVRNALQSIRTAEARLRSASIVRENTQKQYESEQRKLDDGQSDVYKVLERQTALSVARSNELRARTELNKAIADLQRATGNTLKANDVVAK
jgi:outer membrane protein TolC